MSLILPPRDLDLRRPVATGALRPLADSLKADMLRVIERPLYIPEQKALLSREGGRCPSDGTMLDFDPFSPLEHRCPRCGDTFRGPLHDGFWIYWYQLWLAERAVHAAVLGRLGVMPEAAAFAARVLEGYSDQYPRYQNVDNALGPTRPFFSTYLESIWLLQLSIAASLLDHTAHGRTLDRFAGAVVEPSLALIESFDEGGSNRQVWNNAAMQAANLLLGRPDRAESVLWAQSGLAYHLGTSLLDDGTWYEGENYHLFAHRGLWYGIQLSEAAGFELPEELFARYVRGFVTPFLTSLPDLTFPSRRDSQYAISIRQWRFAEWCELGLARVNDRVLSGVLARLYDDGVARADTGRWKNAAEAERNLPPTGLSRADLGWKSMLFAHGESPARGGNALPSILLDAQGIGVIRRNAGRIYVALDYGVSGGGHGHPDRLNIMVSDGDRRVLDDMGTGSYVDPSLHWYRSTLAHNAPMLDGHSQDRVDGELLAFEDRGGAGWMSARAEIDFGSMVTRTVVVMPEYLVDEVRWELPRQRRWFDLPLHMDLQADAPVPSDVRLAGSDGLEDGFRFLRDPRRMLVLSPGRLARLTGPTGVLWLAADQEVEVWTALAPGAPGKPEQRMTLLRSLQLVGTLRWMWSWNDSAKALALFPSMTIENGAEKHEHSRVPHGLQVAIEVGGARSTIDLQGLTRSTDSDDPSAGGTFTQSIRAHSKPISKSPLEFTLGEWAYRRSEQSWREAGSPTARVTLRREGKWIEVGIRVTAERSFVAPNATNRLDNERADINGAGVQLYLGYGQQRAGYVIVPREGGTSLSIRPIDGWGDDIPVEGSWRPADDGYDVSLRLPAGELGIALDLVVNEKPAGRERRRGQLVLSGGEGEFIYLRGDRHDEHRLISFSLSDD